MKSLKILAEKVRGVILSLSLPAGRAGKDGIGIHHASIILSVTVALLYSPTIHAQLNAQSDLFNTVQGGCNYYLDVTANDNLDSLTITQIFIVSQPFNGTTFTNGNFLSYCAPSGFLGTEQFRYSVTAGGQTDTATVYVNVLSSNSSVNPGDADQNGKVENFDVLAIGLAYGFSGPARFDSILNTALAWSPLQFTNNNPGAADCNGDGIVNDADILVVENNFNDTFSILKPYDVDTSVCSISGIPFYIESLSGDTILDGDTLVISIRLGDALLPSEAYGIAFTLEFDNRFIAGNLVQLITNNSWLLQNDTLLSFKKDFQQEGKIEIALTKTNHSGANGGGELLSAIIPIDDNIDGIILPPGGHDLHLKLGKVRLISPYNIVRDVCIAEPSLMVYKMISAIEETKNYSINIYPNPNNGRVMIEADNLMEIKLTDLTGKEILTTEVKGKRKTTLDLSHVATGTYLISVKTRDSLFVKKIFVQP